MKPLLNLTSYETACLVAASGLALFFAAQVPLVIAFRRRFARDLEYPNRDGSHGFTPPAAVVLCLRGPDPFLAQTLRAVLGQDYPNFRLHIVIDSWTDPANAIVDRVLSERPYADVEVSHLREPLSTCSLKCSSLLQAFEELDEDCEAVALVDADTVPHRTWLRELVAPLAQRSVGATTGNRWYAPQDAQWGSLVRYCWNAAAVVQMVCFRIPWGGSLAIRREVLYHCKLPQRIARSLCEDTMMFAALKECGLQVRFLPSVMMVNRESCNLVSFAVWMRRQLVTARLYHPAWLFVAVHGVATSVLPALLALLAVAAVFLAEWRAAAMSLAALLAFFIGSPLLLEAIAASVRTVIQARGEPPNLARRSARWWIVAAIPIAQIVHGAMTLSALALRQVTWRGMRYRIGGPWAIQRQNYRPYQASLNHPQEFASVES